MGNHMQKLKDGSDTQTEVEVRDETENIVRQRDTETETDRQTMIATSNQLLV